MSREQRVTQRKINQSRKKLNTISKGYPSANEGHDGQETIRWVDGKGLFYFVKYNGTWYSHQFNQAPTVSDPKSFADDNLIYSDGRNAFTGNQSHGNNNITNVNDLDVNGHTTLDKTTVDTTDGILDVSGSNNVQVTPEAEITLQAQGATDAPKNVKAIGGKSDFTKYGGVLVESYNKTTESGGTDASNYAANGVHILADAGNTASKHNNIFIEQKNTNAKGNGYGVDIKSSNGVKIRATDNSNSQKTAIHMHSTGGVNIGVTSSNLTGHNSNFRTHIHGKCQLDTLYRPSGQIATDIDVAEGNTAAGNHVKFEAINTDNLVKNFTYKAKDLNLANGSYLNIVSSSDIENTIGTMYLVTVGLRENTNSWQNVAICSRLGLTEWQITTIGQSGSTSNYGTITAKGGGAATGIRWQNNLGVTVQAYGTAQRIIESSDY
jgi:hypothetical protein